MASPLRSRDLIDPFPVELDRPADIRYGLQREDAREPKPARSEEDGRYEGVSETLKTQEASLKAQTFARPASTDAGRKADGLHTEVRGVDVSYGSKKVLRDLNLTLEPGQFTAIVGRSGCGKSTLLRLLAGLEKASAGSVAFNGTAAAPGALREDVRFMFQEPRLLPWKSLLDNVRIGAPGGDKAAALQALDLVGLVDRARDWPAHLSGGQRQRVALARALVGRPRLLLLDEPLGALDALTRIEMQQLIERLWQERRFTAVLVTHDVAEAVALADRVVLLEGGAMTQDTAIELDRPRDKDGDFAHYEKRILDRVMNRHPADGNRDGYAI